MILEMIPRMSPKMNPMCRTIPEMIVTEYRLSLCELRRTALNIPVEKCVVRRINPFEFSNLRIFRGDQKIST